MPHPFVIAAYIIGLIIIFGLVSFAVVDFVKFMIAEKKRSDRNKKSS